MSKSPSSEDTIAGFPGPVVLFASRPKLWFLAFFEIVTILTSSFAIVIGLSDPEARFAVCIGLVGLLYSLVFGVKLVALSSPDAISLRLTSSGFEVSAGLQKRTFLWTQASDFDVFAGRRNSAKVVFRYEGPHRSPFRVGLGWLDAALSTRYLRLSNRRVGSGSHDLARISSRGPALIIAQRACGILAAVSAPTAPMGTVPEMEGSAYQHLGVAV